MQDARTQFLVLMPAGVSAKWRPITWFVIQCDYFLVSSSNISKVPFFRTLVYDGFFKFSCERSIATTRDLLQYCILACKLRNQIYTNFEKRKFHKQSVAMLLKSNCSVVQYLPLYLRPNFLKAMFEVFHT